MECWNGAAVGLVLRNIEGVWEEAFFKFCEVEGRRKGSQRHREEAKRVFKDESARHEGKHLGPNGELVRNAASGVVQGVKEEDPIKTLEVMEHNDQWLLFHVFGGGMSVVVQMGDEEVDAIFSAQHGDVGLPLPTVAK